MQVSIGQAACNALAAYLKQRFTPDVRIYDRWPEPNIKLPPKAISVIKFGKRERLDVAAVGFVDTITPINATTAVCTFRVGSYIQPVQLDAWATSDVERDDLVARLDEYLTAGQDETLDPSLTDDPVRDGVLLPLNTDDGWSGNVDCWLDEPEINDTPESVQRSEFRAMYVGELRGAFSRAVEVPLMTSITLKTKYGPQTVPVQALFETLTLTPTGVVHGTSGT